MRAAGLKPPPPCLATPPRHAEDLLEEGAGARRRVLGEAPAAGIGRAQVLHTPAAVTRIQMQEILDSRVTEYARLCARMCVRVRVRGGVRAHACARARAFQCAVVCECARVCVRARVCAPASLRVCASACLRVRVSIHVYTNTYVCHTYILDATANIRWSWHACRST